MFDHKPWCKKMHSYHEPCDEYIYNPIITDYDRQAWAIFDKRKVTSKERNLGHVLAELFPGQWIYPVSDIPSEPIPYKLNALWDARAILDKLKEYSV